MGTYPSLLRGVVQSEYEGKFITGGWLYGGKDGGLMAQDEFLEKRGGGEMSSCGESPGAEGYCFPW